MIKKLFFLCILILLFLDIGVIFIFLKHQKSVSTQSPIVFFLPHQDDEMFMGGTIHRLIMLGRQVYVVIVTDGAASAAQDILNGTEKDVLDQYCKKQGACYHKPTQEGYTFLNDQAFAKARNQEVFASLTALGVPDNHIFFANPGGINGSSQPEFIDGQLTPKIALRVIKKYYLLFGNKATYVTVTSALGPLNHIHGDHFALRVSLSAFTPITKKYYFSERAGLGRPIVLSKKDRLIKKRALKNYFLWSPRDQRFAIGEHSVGYLIRKWSASGVEYIFDDAMMRTLSSQMDK